MDAPHKVGALVRQRVEVVRGEVKDVRFSAEAGKFEYLVKHGEDAERWFDADHVELDPDAQQPDRADVEGLDNPALVVV